MFPETHACHVLVSRSETGHQSTAVSHAVPRSCMSSRLLQASRLLARTLGLAGVAGGNVELQPSRRRASNCSALPLMHLHLYAFMLCTPCVLPSMCRYCCCLCAVAAPAAVAMQKLPPHHLALSWPWSSARFTNPWPTWTGDKGLGDLIKFWQEMRRVAAPPWGYLSTNSKPSLQEVRCAISACAAGRLHKMHLCAAECNTSCVMSCCMLT